MNKTVRALVVLIVSIVLTGALFFFGTKAIYRGTDAVESIETSIRAAHSDPPARAVQA